jgi:hypothetical protein
MNGCSSEVVNMTHEISIGRSVVEEGPWLIQVERQSGYGSVPGLDDSELADPEELQRQVFVQEWGPVLALPVLGSRSGFHPGHDELGRLDWGAYGTVDFERLYGSFDKARYKADKLREELRRKLITLSVISERLPGNAKHLVLKFLDMGIIDFDHIVSEDMQAIARRHLQAKRLQEEIRELREYSRRKRLAEAQ